MNSLISWLSRSHSGIAAALVAVFLSVAVATTASANSQLRPIEADCVQNPIVHPSDFLNYTLHLTFPSSGYQVTLLSTRVAGHTVHIEVHVHFAGGVHLPALHTVKVHFTEIAPHLPDHWQLTWNGHNYGPAQWITVHRLHEG